MNRFPALRVSPDRAELFTLYYVLYINDVIIN